MSTTYRVTAAFLLSVLVGACGDVTSAPELTPQLEVLGGPPPHACPLSPNIVVHDAPTLFSALEGAKPFDVIGIDGTIELADRNVFIETPRLTLTCATPGSGVRALPELPQGYAVWVAAPDVTLSHLAIDASETRGAVRARLRGDELAARTALLHSHIACGSTACVLFQGVEAPWVADNVITAEGPVTGVHIEGLGARDENGTSPRPIDGAWVQRNVITTDRLSGNAGFGGIRVRDGDGVWVSENQVLGPWQNSVAADALTGSTFIDNELIGGDRHSVAFGASPVQGASGTRGNLVEDNRLLEANLSAILVESGCSNTFHRNTLLVGPESPGVEYAPATGANTYDGQPTRIDDAGLFDCDGDGEPDPNKVASEGSTVDVYTLVDFDAPLDLSGTGVTLGGTPLHPNCPADPVWWQPGPDTVSNLCSVADLWVALETSPERAQFEIGFNARMSFEVWAEDRFGQRLDPTAIQRTGEDYVSNSGATLRREDVVIDSPNGISRFGWSTQYFGVWLDDLRLSR